jgi:hypothetical protein
MSKKTVFLSITISIIAIIIFSSLAFGLPSVTFNITATAGPNGKITPSGNVVVPSGESKEFLIEPFALFRVADVLIDGVSVGNVTRYIFNNVTANHTISATFTKVTFTIVATAGPNGTITPSGNVIVESGATQIFTIKPDPGYRISQLLVNGINHDSRQELFAFAGVNIDQTISVIFETLKYEINATAGPNGTINPSGLVSVLAGADQAFTISPNGGYEVLDIKIDDLSTGPLTSYTFTNVTANHTINVIFDVAPMLIPNISVDVTVGNFLDTNIGNLSNPLFANISNKGSADLNILDIVLSDSNNYSIDLISNPNSNGSTKTKIAPNAIWGFAVIFKPSSLGAKPAVLSIKSDDPNTATLDIPLTGNGIGLKGDVNDDGQVRSNDAILVLRIAASLLEPNAYQKWSADMNDDGNIRSNDAILVLRASAGLGAPVKNIIANCVSIALGEAHGTAGDTVTIPIVVDNKNAFAGGDLVIKYDNSVLLASEIKSDDSILLSANISGGTAIISFAGLEGLKNKEIASIKFKVLANNVSPLSFEKAELYGSDSLPIKTKVINGKFSALAIAPKEAVLFQSFPNPSNPETWIPYPLKDGSEVVIRIYSTSGKLMRQLNLGYMPSGLYTSSERAAHWDGKDMNGEWTASGIYFYSIQAGKFSDVKKLIILR